MEVRDNEKDGRAPRWDISQERAFMATLLGQRFNFLLVFFSIFVAGAVNARATPVLQASVLSLGALVALCLTSAIWRAQHKLDLILEILFQDPTHPAAVIDKKVMGRSRRQLIGYAIPMICSGALAAWALLAWLTVIRHGDLLP